MIATTKNPFPSGGVTRPGLAIKKLREIPSQQGAVERIELLIGSVASHGTTQEAHEGAGRTSAGKPEFVTLTGPFGSGKTLTLRKIYDDCKNGRIQSSEEKQKVVAVPIYQPLHSLIKEPGQLIDILIERLEVEAPNVRIREAISKERSSRQGGAKADELLLKINTWRRCVDAAVANGVDVVVILLDELEETVADYDRFADQYKDMVSEIREFTDREVGPVVVVLATTPNALKAIFERSKQAMFRRMVPLELLNLTSPEELQSLIEEYDPGANKYLTKEALRSLYAETRGIPGYALSAMSWAWEEMQAQKKSKIDPDLIYSAAQTVTWKGQSVARETQRGPQDPQVKKLLDTVKPAAEAVRNEDVVRGAISSLGGIGLIENADEKTYQRLRESLETRNTKVAENSIALTRVEPQNDVNVSYLIMTLLADDQHLDEASLKGILDAFEEQNGDIMMLLIPNESASARRSADHVLQGKQYRGLPWSGLTIRVVLTTEKRRDFAALARFTGSPRELGDAAQSIGLTYGTSTRFVEILGMLQREGKTLPYRWDLRRIGGQKKEQTFGLYYLITKRFTNAEFSGSEAADWVMTHYNDISVLRDSPEKEGYVSVKEWAEYATSYTLEILDGQGLAQKKGAGGDRYFIPPLVPCERELYNITQSLHEELGQNPGFDDINQFFFGLRKARGYDFWGIAFGMEGKGYLQSYQEGARRFYRAYEVKERQTAVEIALGRFEKELPGLISHRLTEDKIALTDLEIAEFAERLLTSLKSGRDRVGKYLNETTASKGDDIFEELRTIAKADLEVVLLQDAVKEQVGKWSTVKSELGRLGPSLERKEEISKRLADKKRLTSKRAAEIQSQLAEIRDSLPKIHGHLAKFETEKAAEAYSVASNKLAKIDEELNDKLGDLANAEKEIQEAELSLLAVGRAIDPRSSASKSLGIDKEFTKLEKQLESIKNDAAKGKMPEEVPSEDLPSFVARVVDPKLEEAKDKLEALRRAEELLGALGQPDEADGLMVKTGKIEGTLAKAQRTRSQNLYKPYIEWVSDSLGQADDAWKTLDRLVTVFKGGRSKAEPEFNRDGVDKAMTKPLHPLTQAQVRDLRHLLEDMGAITCIDVR